MTTGYVCPSIRARDRQQEVLDAVRDRDLSLTRLRGWPQALVLQGYRRRVVLHGGLGSLTIGQVQRFGASVGVR